MEGCERKSLQHGQPGPARGGSRYLPHWPRAKHRTLKTADIQTKNWIQDLQNTNHRRGHLTRHNRSLTYNFDLRFSFFWDVAPHTWVLGDRRFEILEHGGRVFKGWNLYTEWMRSFPSRPLAVKQTCLKTCSTCLSITITLYSLYTGNCLSVLSVDSHVVISAFHK